MNTKHTPGPWTVHETMRDCVTFDGPEGMENLFLCNIDGYYACQSEADARLIAAAPDLLEALILLEHEMVESGNAHSRDYGWKPAIEKTRAAIAKATGEE